MKELASQLSKQVHEGKRLDEEIIRNLEHLGYGE
jgi:hypothetical protein